MLTPADLFDQLAPYYGDAGICVQTEADKRLIMDALDQAIPLLSKRLDAKGTLMRTKVRADGGCFCLPYDCLEVRSVHYNCQPVDLADEYHEWRVGEVSSGDCYVGPLIDVGDNFPIPKAWPSYHFDTRLAFSCENDADVGVEVQVKFTDRYGHEYTEFLTMPADQQLAISVENVTDILFIRKPQTIGGVKLHVYYPQTKRWRQHARYAPQVTIPAYRKKKLNIGPYCGDLIIKGKKRFFPIRDENEVLPIDDIEALQFALKALAAKVRGDDQDYQAKLSQAVRALDLQLSDSHAPGTVTQMKVRGPLGRSAFRRRCWA